ncbi:nucleoside phosphorylase [Stappia sp. 22II-S9-Z10]|nr:nucleoside phosphorylase [Stappia sp. 22II-S9-Z10]
MPPTSATPTHAAEPNRPGPDDGVLVLVVGPSGVGKDSLIDGARPRLPASLFHFARRVVTRPREAGGEDHEPMTLADFEAAEAGEAFAVTWGAHGLRYGIRHAALAPLRDGRNVIVNASRQSLAAFAAIAGRVVVVSVTAPPAIVRARLEARGREDAAEVAERLGRQVPLVGAQNIAVIDNGGALAEGVGRFVAAVLGAARLPLTVTRLPLSLPGGPVALLNQAALPLTAGQLSPGTTAELRAADPGPSPAGTSTAARGGMRVAIATAADDALVAPGEVGLPAGVAPTLAAGAVVTLRPARAAASRDALRRKVAGAALGAAEIGAIVEDIAAGRYSEAEVAGFLVAAARGLSPDEVAAFTAARAGLVPRLAWDAPLVLDKHSMGGVPGDPASLIVVPIVAAAGQIIPKTSSRAITSAAGTADIMECAAAVDLTPDDLRRTVAAAGGAIAWSGRIAHSALDDVMNAINRPLGIASAELDVASILSKKRAAGATHVIVDIPVGPAAKVKTAEDARRLAALFTATGAAVGLTVVALPSDGRQPIGRGVGPALELQDALAVLQNNADAPEPLRAKALAIAGRLLDLVPEIAARPGAGAARAAELLASGAALASFEAIAEAQGPHPRARPGAFRRDLLAPRSGTVAAVDIFAVAGLARAVGAPADKGAGVRLVARPGDEVREGAPLAEVAATSQHGIDIIRAEAAGDVYKIA